MEWYIIKPYCMNSLHYISLHYILVTGKLGTCDSHAFSSQCHVLCVRKKTTHTNQIIKYKSINFWRWINVIVSHIFLKLEMYFCKHSVVLDVLIKFPSNVYWWWWSNNYSKSYTCRLHWTEIKRLDRIQWTHCMELCRGCWHRCCILGSNLFNKLTDSIHRLAAIM